MNERILIVDDEPAIRRLVQVNLLRAGYQVQQAADGREAFAKLREERPDIVISDVMMPHMDGFALLKAMREDPETRDIPVVLLTAKASDADVFEGYVQGTDLYLTKPFSPRELLAFVRRILDTLNGPGEGGRYNIG